MTIAAFLKGLDKTLIRKQLRAISPNVRKVLWKINNGVLQLVISLDTKRMAQLRKNRIHVISQEYCETIWYPQWSIFSDKRIATSSIYETSREYFSLTTMKKEIDIQRSPLSRSSASKKSISLISFLSAPTKMTIARGVPGVKGRRFRLGRMLRQNYTSFAETFSQFWPSKRRLRDTTSQGAANFSW